MHINSRKNRKTRMIMKKQMKLLLLSILFFIKMEYSYGQLTGTYTVGSLGGENFSSLTNIGGFFDVVNTNGLSGNVILQITSDLPGETGNIPLNAISGGFTISIVPKTASVKTITHIDCSNDLILFNGVDNVSIDGSFGGSGKYLKWVSPCNNQSVIRLYDDCENITIKNSIILSDNNQTSVTNGGAIHVDEDQTNGSDNLHIINNAIADYSGPIDLFDAIQVNAPKNAGGVLTGLQIIGNEMYNANGKGVFVVTNNGEVNKAQILRNSFYATGTITGPGLGWAYAIIQMESGSGHIIKGNYFGGQGPKCTGGKMDVQLTSGSLLVTLIRMKQELPNATANEIDSNVIRNMSIINGYADEMNLSLIRLERGNNNVGVNEGNIIGDVNVDASSKTSASIAVENFDNTGNTAFYAIRTTSSGTTNIENNKIGGIFLENDNLTGIIAYLVYSNGSSANIVNNIIGGVTNNIVKSSDYNFRVIYSNGDNLPFSISGNTISGITSNKKFSDDFYGIYVRSGSGAPTVNSNKISDINIIGTNVFPRVYGIRVDNSNALIDGNQVTKIILDSKYTTQQFFGIYCNKSSNTATISNNIMSDIHLLTPSAKVAAIGIETVGSSSNYTINNNFLDQFEICSTSTSCYFRMIYVNSALNNTLINNVILIDNANRNSNFNIYGIYDNNSNSSGWSNIWHNTIDIRGTSTGAVRTACYYKNNSADRNIQNNIFNNKRKRDFGSGSNYAMYFASTSGSLICNYNLLYCEDDLNELVYYSGSKDFSTWQGTGNASNSLTGVAPQNLVDFNTGEQTTYLGNDLGNSTLGIGVDYASNFRPADSGYDMGAFEIPTVNLLQPLPVELLWFNGKCNDNGSLLEWVTTSEINNNYFTIYQSSDARNWEKVTTIPGGGNSNQQLKYHYKVQNVLSSDWQYYKLTQTDFDGSTKELGITTSNCKSVNDNCFNIYPNPSNGEYAMLEFFECGDEQPVSIVIKDMLGRTIWKGQTGGGNKVLSIQPDEKLAKGTYVVNAQYDSKILSKKLIVQ